MNTINIFEYFETLSKNDRKVTAKELKALYNDALHKEQETYAERMRNKRSHSKRQKYFEARARLDAITDIFDVLGIEWEGGAKL